MNDAYISRNDPCPCGSRKKYKKCCYHKKKGSTSKPLTVHERYKRDYNILIKTPEQIQGIRKACRFTAEVLQKLMARAKEGVTTEELDQLAAKLINEKGAIAAPLHYGGPPPYPKHICTSINDEVCHGIPGDIPLKKGDIVNIDVSCIVDGYFGDCSAMVGIGDIDAEKRQLLDTTHSALLRAISIVKPGVALNKIGDVISDYAEKMGFSVVEDFVGHGIGLHFHEGPAVHHNRNNMNIPLIEGMTFTIEPMINAGTKANHLISNQWTAKTDDGKPSAQWEHTVLVTPSGYEILTLL